MAGGFCPSVMEVLPQYQMKVGFSHLLPIVDIFRKRDTGDSGFRKQDVARELNRGFTTILQALAAGRGLVRCLT